MNNKTLLENTSINKNEPQVVLSVVCAVFNGGGVIADMLNSYAKQKRKDTELIVIDGASTDNTLDIIKDSGVADIVISE
jgi:glycosyltransferase involved in cell wall biosynthesis